MLIVKLVHLVVRVVEILIQEHLLDKQLNQGNHIPVLLQVGLTMEILVEIILAVLLERVVVDLVVQVDHHIMVDQRHHSLLFLDHFLVQCLEHGKVKLHQLENLPVEVVVLQDLVLPALRKVAVALLLLGKQSLIPAVVAVAEELLGQVLLVL